MYFISMILHSKLHFVNKISEQFFFFNIIQILENKKQGKDTTSLEHEIDVKVYHLYELNLEQKTSKKQ